jgi:hypothetical protein
MGKHIDYRWFDGYSFLAIGPMDAFKKQTVGHSSVQAI